jgi:antitoxin component YwqK of YwqJK toxin-antitoxin module
MKNELETYVTYYDNGQKKVEGNPKDGKLEGLWTYWYENGQKNSELNYKDC